MKHFAKLLIAALAGYSLTFAALTFAHHPNKEKFYQTQHSAQVHGEMEVRLEDGARVDLVYYKDGLLYATEHDFSSKWAECAGQAILYAVRLDADYAVCALILDPTKPQLDKKRIQRVRDIGKVAKIPLIVVCIDGNLREGDEVDLDCPDD